MSRAAIYTRISIDPDGRSTATARQLEDCERHIAARGWEHVGTYEDPDISAYDRRAVRPSFERMKADIVAGRVDVVVAWKMDRLWRRARDFADLDEVCETAGARIVTVVDGIDTSTSAGRLVATVMTGMARAESENISIRARRKAAELARDGKIAGGGRRLFGYESRMTGIVPEEAALLREAARRILDGEAINAICRDWNTRGIRTTGEKGWRSTALRRTLSTYQVTGRRFYEGVPYPARWDAILTVAEHAALLRLFDARGGQPAAIRTHFLSRLLRCGLCGHVMVGKQTSRGARGYGCVSGPDDGGCGRIRRRADPLEEYVRDLIFERVASPTFAESMARQATPDVDVDTILAAIRDDEMAVEELAHDRYVSRMLGAAEFASAHAALTLRLDAHRKRLAAMAPSDSGIDFETVREAWPGASADWRARVAAALIDHVAVGQSPRGRLPFHAESVVIHWRF